MRLLIAAMLGAGALGSLACARAGETAAPDEATIERGIEVYARERCQTCHSIDGQGNRRYPLDGVGSRLTREQIRTWIVAPQQMNPQVRKRAHDSLSVEDLDGLVAYMESLKAG